MTLVLAVMHLYILEFFIASVYSFKNNVFFVSVFFSLQKNLVLINRRNVPRYQRVPALRDFFKRSNTEEANSSKILCLMFVYVFSKFVSGLTVWFSDHLQSK